MKVTLAPVAFVNIFIKIIQDELPPFMVTDFITRLYDYTQMNPSAQPAARRYLAYRLMYLSDDGKQKLNALLECVPDEWRNKNKN